MRERNHETFSSSIKAFNVIDNKFLNNFQCVPVGQCTWCFGADFMFATNTGIWTMYSSPG